MTNVRLVGLNMGLIPTTSIERYLNAQRVVGFKVDACFPNLYYLQSTILLVCVCVSVCLSVCCSALTPPKLLMTNIKLGIIDHHLEVSA